MLFDRMFRNLKKTCNDFVGLTLDHMSKYLLFTRSELAEELLLGHIRPHVRIMKKPPVTCISTGTVILSLALYLLGDSTFVRFLASTAVISGPTVRLSRAAD